MYTFDWQKAEKILMAEYILDGKNCTTAASMKIYNNYWIEIWNNHRKIITSIPFSLAFNSNPVYYLEVYPVRTAINKYPCSIEKGPPFSVTTWPIYHPPQPGGRRIIFLKNRGLQTG